MKNVGYKLFIKVRRRKNYVSCYYCRSLMNNLIPTVHFLSNPSYLYETTLSI